MNKEITNLPAIYAEINEQYKLTELHKSMAVLHATAAGAAISQLIKALGIKKGTGGSGDRDKGLSTALAINCPEINYRTATVYLNLYESPDNFDLPLSSKILMLGASDDVKQVVTEKLTAGESVSHHKIQELNKKHKEELARTAEANKAAFIKTTNLYDVKLVDLNKQYQQTLKEKNALDQQVANLRNNTADPLHEPKVKAELEKLANKIAQRDNTLLQINKELSKQQAVLDEKTKRGVFVAAELTKKVQEVLALTAKIRELETTPAKSGDTKKLKMDLVRLNTEKGALERQLKEGSVGQVSILDAQIKFVSDEIARYNKLLVELQTEKAKLTHITIGE